MKKIKMATALLLTLITLGGNIGSVGAKQPHEDTDSLIEVNVVSSQIRVTKTVVYGKGSSIQPSLYVSQQHNGYYYSGWIPMTNRITHSNGSVTATYSGLIYGGSGTTSKVVENK